MRGIRGLLNITGAREKTRAAICSAIKSQRIIEFYYHGGYRTVEPFCLGLVMSGEPENESLLCYQLGGYSELREVVGWKLYRASEMEDISISKEQFEGDRPGYDPDDIDMAEIYCCVRLDPNLVRIARVAPEAKAVTGLLTHNELMRRFRFAHPLTVPELYSLFFPDPLHSPFPEPPESKNKPLVQLFEDSLDLAKQAA